jgi:hypothetical protein
MSELYSRAAPTLRYESPYVSLQASKRQRCMHAVENNVKECSHPFFITSFHILFASREGKVRVGFLSKFFVENHPHGALLQGIVRHLDRGMY